MSSTGDDGAGIPAPRSKDTGERYRKISTDVLITAILCLVFTVVFAALLHVYLKFVIRRQTRRRRAAVALLRMGTQIVQQAQDPPPPPTVGLDPAVIATLPRYAYKSAAAGSTGPDASPPSPECAVCLSTVAEGEMVKVMPNCKHTFHDECIDMWLHSHSTCPICRAGAAPATVVDADPVLSVADEPSGACGDGALDRRGSCREDSSTSSAARPGTSLRRILSRERSCGVHDGDLERQ